MQNLQNFLDSLDRMREMAANATTEMDREMFAAEVRRMERKLRERTVNA
jgi:flagellin-like hook-associated protein FlgL